MAVSFIGGGNWRKPPTSRKSLTNYHISCIEYTSPGAGFELITLVAIDTYYTGGCNSNYHTIKTTTALHT